MRSCNLQDDWHNADDRCDVQWCIHHDLRESKKEKNSKGAAINFIAAIVTQIQTSLHLSGLERPRLLPYSLCVPIMACLLIPGTDYTRCARWLEYWSYNFQTTFAILPAQSLLLVVSRYPLGQVHTKLPSVLLQLYWHKDCGHSSMSIMWTNIWILNDVLLFVGETWFTD